MICHIEEIVPMVLSIASTHPLRLASIKNVIFDTLYPTIQGPHN
jgi:hypothetical protein